MSDLIVPADSEDAPYWDDFDSSKGFHKIMFRPGRAVQARELTQLQTILQKQIAKFGDGIYRNGSMVTGGQITYQGIAESISYANIESTYYGNTVDPAPFIYTTVKTSSNGRGTVVAYSGASSNTPATLVIKYSSGLNKGRSGDTITIVPESSSTNVFNANISSSGTGNAAIATISKGVYYFNGYFVDVMPQTLILDKYSSTPSCRIGLQFNDSIIDENYDSTLLDPAQEASNYQAPGATRYQIILSLEKRSLTSTDDSKFIELLRVEDGVVIKKVEYPTFSELNKTMARRTFDESGNYTVRPFLITLTDHRPEVVHGNVTVSANGTVITGLGTTFIHDAPANSNVYINSQTSVVTVSTSNTSLSVNPVLRFNPADSQMLVKNPNKFSVVLSSGKAYIKGFEFETAGPVHLGVDRGRDYNSVSDYSLETTLGNYLYVDSLVGLPDIPAMEKVDLHYCQTANSINLFYTSAYNSTVIGNARIRAIEYVSTTANTAAANSYIYKVYLFDVNMSNNTYGLAQVNAIANLRSTTANAFNILMNVNSQSKSSGNTFLSDPNFNTLIFKYPYSRIKPVITNQDYRYRKVVKDVSFTAGVATVTVSGNENVVGSGTLAESLSFENYGVWLKTQGTIPSANLGFRWENSFTRFWLGKNMPLTSLHWGGSTVVTGTTQVTFTTGVAYNFTADILYTVDTTGSPGQRTKTQVTSNTLNVMSGGTGTTISNTNTQIFLTQGQVQVFNSNNVVKIPGVGQKLYVSDIIGIRKVLNFGHATANNITEANIATAQDVTASYLLDSGQRDSYYGHGSIYLKSGKPTPNGNIAIWFDYYTHTGSTGYLTVDSYPSVSTNQGYALVPMYKSPTTGITYALADCVDWRPINQNAVEFPGLFGDSAGSSVTIISKPGNAFVSDFSYYLSRIDRLVLSDDSNFKIIRGKSALQPSPPNVNPDDMLLYTLHIPAYTINASDVTVKFNDNKRFTMRDIGKLEKRIENVEYYTSLSLLEKSTESLTILDPAGLNRFKSGMVVDNFTGHKVGDVTSYDYACSMDFVKGQLWPPYTSNTLPVIIDDTQPPANANTDCGGITYIEDVTTTEIIMDYTLEDYIVQDSATGYEPINPVAVTAWNGRMYLSPYQVDFYATIVPPQVLTNYDGENDAFETFDPISLNTDKGSYYSQSPWWEETTSLITKPVTDLQPYVASGSVLNPFSTSHGFWKYNWFGVVDDIDYQISESFGNMLTQEGGVVGDRTNGAISGDGIYGPAAGMARPRGSITVTSDGRVHDMSVIPRMPQIDVTISAYDLQPSAVFYPFFNNVGVLGFWINPTYLRLDVQNQVHAPQAQRYLYNEPITTTSGCRATVASVPTMFSNYANTVNPWMTVVNPSGNVANGDTVTGALGAVATILEVIKPSSNIYAATANTSQVNVYGVQVWTNTFTRLYLGNPINFPKGPGAGQVRIVTGYSSSTGIISLNKPLDIAVNTSTVYNFGTPISDVYGKCFGTLAMPLGAFVALYHKVRLTTSSTNAPDHITSSSEADLIAHPSYRYYNIVQEAPVQIVTQPNITTGGKTSDQYQIVTASPVQGIVQANEMLIPVDPTPSPTVFEYTPTETATDVFTPETEVTSFSFPWVEPAPEASYLPTPTQAEMDSGRYMFYEDFDGAYGAGPRYWDTLLEEWTVSPTFGAPDPITGTY